VRVGASIEDVFVEATRGGGSRVTGVAA